MIKNTVLCHFFYPSVSQELLDKLKVLDGPETLFLVSIQGRSQEHKELEKQVNNVLTNKITLLTPHFGRDIGAKFLLINLLLQLGITSEYTLIIHDKKSPHMENGGLWRNELYKIIEPGKIGKVFSIFMQDQKVGIVSSAKFIQNEYQPDTKAFTCNSSDKILQILKKHRIVTSNYDYVAGNIFWIRTHLLQEFFRERSIPAIRSQLEYRNALDFNNGTYIHSWERIMSWIATSQGYSIYGI